jgi:ATP-dependent Lhr-like helicase
VVASRCGTLAFAAENLRTIEALYPGADVTPRVALPAHLPAPPLSMDRAVLAVVRGHSEILGPFTSVSLAVQLGLDPSDVSSAVAKLESEGIVLRGRFTPRVGEEEVCDRRLLARIHRLTLDRLRSEIAPVSAQDFLRYLFERHHLTARSRIGGRAGLRDAIGMLQGFEIAAAAWERHVLPARVVGYRPEWLDDLCLAGEVAWARLSPRRSKSAATGSTSRVTPITLALRRDLGWLLEGVRGSLDPEPPTSMGTTATLEALRRRGALFLDDIAAGTGLSRHDLRDALWDLVGRGLVTNDGWQPLRDLMALGRATRSSGPGAQGRWSIVERTPFAQATPDQLANRVAAQLLARYGVALRELVARESFAVPWRDVIRALRLAEARGLVRGGRFVAGFLGEQYALPDAVDALRDVRRRERTGEVVRLQASDPLNLVGIVTPGRRVSANPGPCLIFRDGAFVAPASQPADDLSSARALTVG